MSRSAQRSKRRTAFAQATWDIILNEGISHVSIRSVAARAGVSAGSLRHVFASKAALMDFALELVEEHAQTRIERHFALTDPCSVVENIIDELLPLDEQRRAEMQVTMAMYAQAPNDPQMRQLHSESHQVMTALLEQLLQHLREHQLLRADVDIPVAAVQLLALIDGYAMHMIAVNEPRFTATGRAHIHQHWKQLMVGEPAADMAE